MSDESFEDSLAANIEMGFVSMKGPETFSITEMGTAYAKSMGLIRSLDDESIVMGAFAAGYRAAEKSK